MDIISLILLITEVSAITKDIPAPGIIVRPKEYMYITLFPVSMDFIDGIAGTS